jgi:hypothetical protein
MAKAVANINDTDKKQRGFGGNFPLFLQSGCPEDDINNCFFTKIDRESQRMNNTVQTQLTKGALRSP